MNRDLVQRTSNRIVLLNEKKLKILDSAFPFNEHGMSDKDCMKLVGCSKNTYYLYKSELKQQLSDGMTAEEIRHELKRILDTK